MKIIKQHRHPKLNEAIQSLLLPHREDFYFFFLGHVDFYEVDPASVEMPTAGVTVINMRLAFIWCQSFIDSLSVDETLCQLRALLLHEIFHLLDNHIERGKGYVHQIADIAMDMIINHLIVKHHTFDSRQRKMTELSEGWVKLDPNYKGLLVFEPLYEWLQQENNKRKQGKSHELSEQTGRLLDQAESGQTVDLHELPDEIQAEIKRQISNEVVQKAKIAASRAGNLPGSVEDVLKVLLKAPKKDNLKLLRRVIGAHKGKTKVDSFKRSNRRIEGLKGYKKIGQAFVGGLDTSGSMWGRFDKVLSELFRDGYTFKLVMCDTKVTDVIDVKDKNQLTKLPVSGGGGTMLNPIIEWVQNPKNKCNKLPGVILTDGAIFETLDFKGSNQQWLILSLGDAPIQYVNGSNVRVIEIKE